MVLTGAGQLLHETSSLCKTANLILGYHGVTKNIRETWEPTALGKIADLGKRIVAVPICPVHSLVTGFN